METALTVVKIKLLPEDAIFDTELLLLNMNSPEAGATPVVEIRVEFSGSSKLIIIFLELAESMVIFPETGTGPVVSAFTVIVDVGVDKDTP